MKENMKEIKDSMKILRKFKNKTAESYETPGVTDWSEYILYCKSNGFDESEIGYDDLMYEYGKFIKSGLTIDEWFNLEENE